MRKPLFITLIFFTLSAKAQYAFNIENQTQINDAWALNSFKTIKAPQNGCNILADNFSKTIEILIFQDENNLDQYVLNTNARLTELEQLTQNSPYYNFIKAEMLFQLGLVKFLFDKEWSASIDLIKAYNLLEENEKKYPNFIFHKRTLGLFHVLLSSVPEKYQWVLKTLGFNPNKELGIKELEFASKNDTIFKKQSELVYYFSYLTIKKSKQNINFYPAKDDLIALYGYFSLQSKVIENEKLLAIAIEKKIADNVHKMPFWAHLLGNIYIKKGEYLDAKRYFLTFLTLHKGKILLKDSYYKLSLIERILSNNDLAKSYGDSIKTKGNEKLDNDKKAFKNANLVLQKPVWLIKSNLYFDGAYFELAKTELEKASLKELNQSTIRQEYYYRKARIFQMENEQEKAIFHFKQVLEIEIKDNYFAPNACLQMAKIYINSQPLESKKYLKQCIEYEDFEYEFTIKSEAKTMLKELE